MGYDKQVMGYAGTIDHARPRPIVDYKRKVFGVSAGMKITP